MSSTINPPEIDRSFAICADWLELLCILRESGRSSEIDLTGPNDIMDDRIAIIEGGEEDHEDLDIVDPPLERALDALAEELQRREAELGAAYPFKSRITAGHIHMARTSRATDVAIQRGRAIYIACLLISAIRTGLIDYRAANIQPDPEIGNLFQICATLAAAGYVRGDAYWFGHPRPDNTRLIDAVQRLVTLVKMGQARTERPEGETRYAKDVGVDVVAWRGHSDDRPSKLVVYGQCASGLDWEGKPVGPKVNRLEGYFWRAPVRHWLPALFLPFPLYMGKESTHSLKDNASMEGFYSQIESEMGLIIDRSRVVTCSIEALRDLGESAKVAFDNLHLLDDWCENTTRQLGSAV